MASSISTGGPSYLELYEAEALKVERYASASYWDARYHRQRMARIVKLLSGMIMPGASSFLDAGCGSGEYLMIAAGLGATTIGVDLSHNYTVRARRQSEQSHVGQASLGALPFKDASIDVVLCTEVLEHLPADIYRAALAELFRISRRVVVITTANDGLLRRLGNALLWRQVSRLDASVGHISIFPLRRLLRMLRNRDKEWSIKSARTIHILPPVVGERLHLSPHVALLVSSLENLLNVLLPRQGNVSIVVCKPAAAEPPRDEQR